MLLQCRKVAPDNCSPKLFFKIATESRVPKKKKNSNAVAGSCLKASPESCPKLLPKAAPQNCYPKLFPGTAPQSCVPKLSFKAVALKLRFCKPVRQNGSATQRHSAKRLPKAAP